MIWAGARRLSCLAEEIALPLSPDPSSSSPPRRAAKTCPPSASTGTAEEEKWLRIFSQPMGGRHVPSISLPTLAIECALYFWCSGRQANTLSSLSRMFVCLCCVALSRGRFRKRRRRRILMSSSASVAALLRRSLLATGVGARNVKAAGFCRKKQINRNKKEDRAW